MTDSIPPILDPPDLRQGIVFESHSTYELIRRLGRGGMGEVWLADRISAGNHVQKVAVKFLFDAHASRQLAQEAMKMSQLNHDNIVPFVDSGRDFGGRYFVAMSHIRGMNLDGLKTLVGLNPVTVWAGETQYRIPDKMVGFIAFMVLRGLSYAHEYVFEDGTAGIIHRDVSPGNILIDEAKGFVKLTDFGVATQQTGDLPQIQVAGKVPYMAPEVLMEGEVDARADLYSLGVVIYELLTGFNPNLVTGLETNVLGAITSVMLALEKPLCPPHMVQEGIDEDLSQIVVHMLATEPAERYHSAEEIITELTTYLYSSGVGPNTSSLASYIKLLKHRHLAPTKRDINAMPFLVNTDGILDFNPRFCLSDMAKQTMENNRSPGRIWDD
jgi:eukaryotic-like serine/threonine-protein kinase